jgi:predicted DNA-binding transcriptional regulator YafY
VATTINKKINHIYLLLEKLADGEELYPQNTRVQSELEINERTLRRYLEDIHQLYSHIVITQKIQKEFSDRRVSIYRVVDKESDVSSIFKFFLHHSDDLSWLLQLVHENNPSLLRDYKDESKKSLHKIIKEDEEIFLFVSSPFETFKDATFSKVFLELKTAVKNHEYRDVDYHYDSQESLKNLKCLKLVYMNNNWYIGVESESGDFRFLRLSFIQKIHYSKKVTYQVSLLEKYRDFFSSLQNAMTRNEPFNEAKLRATPRVAKYFKESMKPFFPSQKFVQEYSDGSIDFTIDFTHYMEIAPFIKQWQPDITVLSPKRLREQIQKDLLAGAKLHGEP